MWWDGGGEERYQETWSSPPVVLAARAGILEPEHLWNQMSIRLELAALCYVMVHLSIRTQVSEAIVLFHHSREV